MADLFHLPYVRAVCRLLTQRLTPNGRLCLFGAGTHTHWLLNATRDMLHPENCCIVDDAPPAATINGISVSRPDEVAADSIDFVLVSSDRWERELADRARTVWQGKVEIVRLYEGLPSGPYEKQDDRTEALSRLKDRGSRRSVSNRMVVLVTDRPGPREAKIGFALSSAGYTPILLHRQAPLFDATRIFDHVRAYNHEWAALRYATEYEPLAYHIFVNSDYRIANLFLEHRPGIVVVDPYDVIAGMYSDPFRDAHPAFVDELTRERHCLEAADGVCCRSREVDFLRQQLGYDVGPQLFLPDGCWNRPRPATSRRSQGIHTAYAGHLEPATQSRGGFTGHGCKLWLAKTLAAQGIHFHLYPWHDASKEPFDDAFRAYRQLETETPFFHLHRTVGCDDLIDELAQYDLAMFVYNEVVQPGPVVENFTQAKFRHCAGNKIFDFMDAGLPIVHSGFEGSLIAETLDRYQIRIEVGHLDPDTWGDLLRTLDISLLRERACQAREAYDVRRGVGRLIHWYQSLHDGAHPQSKALVTIGELENNHDANNRSQYASTVL